MAQIEMAPRARSRRIGARSDSGWPRLVLVPSLRPEPEAAIGVPPELEAATGLAEPPPRIVQHGSVRARRLLPTPPVPVRVRPQPQSPPMPSRTEQREQTSRGMPVWSKAGPPPVRRPAGLPVRLTTRGRVVVVAILVAPLLLMLSLLFRSQVDASSEPTAPRSYPVIVVQPGDTLWTIAGRAAPDRDPRAVIHQIREINGLSGASIQAGQRLALPPG
jgi:LysM domain